MIAPRERRIVFLIAPYVHLLDLGGPVQVFDSANQNGGCYKLVFCATAPDIHSSVGLGFAGFNPLIPADHLGPEDMVIVPGVRWKNRHPKSLMNAVYQRYLRDSYEAGAMISSVCSGAFALGESGLLDGRRCTTHWSLTKELQKRFPAARVVDDILFTRDGRITTSAGIASGIDLALSLVELHYGPIVTARVARDLVVYLRRTGEHRQQHFFLQYRSHIHTAVHRIQEWLNEHPHKPASLDQLSHMASMSPSTLTRTFKKATGLTPWQYQQRARLELASGLMRDSRLTLEAIAEKCGYNDVRHFRRVWSQRHHEPPSISREKKQPATSASRERSKTDN
jgi:transcriptional regulator GlxA family with amidase domain